jgi:hypothetical protein
MNTYVYIGNQKSYSKLRKVKVPKDIRLNELNVEKSAFW